MMVSRETSFEEDQLRATRAFAHTMIVVDDEAGESRPPESDFDSGIPVAEPSRGDARTASDPTPQDPTPMTSHPLDRKAVVESALNLGLVCAVVKPDPEQQVANNVANAAERADIVSLDWQMNDHGEKAQSIVKEIVQRDTKKGGRLRLIAVYTGVNDRAKIFDDILKVIPERTINDQNIRIVGDYIVSDKGLRIVWLYKSGGIQLPGQLMRYQIKEAELAEHLQKEFSKLSDGLLSNVALATIAALRDATHRTLGKFTGRMDGPYFHHRAFLPVPQDAQDYAVSIVLSDLKSAVDRSEVGDRYAGATSIKNRIGTMAPSNGAFVLKPHGETSNQNHVAQTDMIQRIVLDGYSKDTQPSTFPGKDKTKECFTSVFQPDFNEARDAMMAFASLTGVQSHPRSSLHGKAPRLVLGSIIESKENEYLLCLQASCDAIRVSDGDKFFFILLEEKDRKADHIVPRGVGGESNQYLGLSAVKAAYTKARTISFPTSGPNGGKVVRATKTQDVSEYWFTDSEKKLYRWIANLKPRRAMRSAQQVSQALTRIGFDEFEPFRIN